MKKFNYLLPIVMLMALFNACKKDNPGNSMPDPSNPTGEEMILPKKQMRAVWMATAWGLDWPQEDYNIITQQQQYISYLEKFKQLKMNAVFVQVKGMGDAFYNSPYEPWSAAVTGTRGKDPGYDVLKFMIDEAHARGIEFHAWLNPYRIATRAGINSSYPALHSSVKPEWIISHEKIQIYNPARPEVRQRLADIVKDIITKYEVDGIHFDDYFYPDPTTAGQMVSDQGDYQTYKTGSETTEQFRRSNVDKAIKGVRDVIIATKPEVVFSVSPASDFTYNLNTMYADIKKWAAEGWMDVVIPQLYSNSSFSGKLTEWDMFNNKPFLMIGHGFYVMNSSSELSSQLSLTKSKKAVVGTLLYSAKYLNQKPEVTNKLAELWSDPAILPFLGRAIAPAPATPQNVQLENNILKWTTSDNVKSVVYFTTDIKKEAKVLTITSANQANVAGTGFYSVTTINTDNKESVASKPIKK